MAMASRALIALFLAMLAASPARGWADGAQINAQAALAAPVATASPAPSPTGDALKVFIADMMGWGEVANLTLMPGEEVRLTVMLVDAQGGAIGGQALEIRSSAGNGIGDAKPVTDKAGRADVTITARKLGTDDISVSTARAATNVALIVQQTVDGQAHTFKVAPKSTAPRAVAGAIPWATFAKVEVTEGEDGLEIPKFSSEVKQLNGRKVKIQGFMVPLENEVRQKHFVLSSTPPTCFYCIPGGPESLVEIDSTKGLVFTFEPIVLTGTLDVMENNDLGLFYRLRNAVPETSN